MQYKTIWEAASAGDTVAIRKFLEDNSIDVNAKNDEGHTLLHIAALAGSPETIKVLLEHNADHKAEDSDKRTPLEAAVDHYCKVSIELIALLLAKGTPFEDLENIVPHTVQNFARPYFENNLPSDRMVESWDNKDVRDCICAGTLKTEKDIDKLLKPPSNNRPKYRL